MNFLVNEFFLVFASKPTKNLTNHLLLSAGKIEAKRITPVKKTDRATWLEGRCRRPISKSLLANFAFTRMTCSRADGDGSLNILVCNVELMDKYISANTTGSGHLTTKDSLMIDGAMAERRNGALYFSANICPPEGLCAKVCKAALILLNIQ